MRAFMSALGWLAFGGLASVLGVWAMTWGDLASYAVFAAVLIGGGCVMYATESKGVRVDGWKGVGEKADHATHERDVA